MTSKHDLTIDIDELYDALLIPRTGPILCFAYNVNAEDGECGTVLDKNRRKKIKRPLSRVLESEAAAETLEDEILEALEKLAKVLACPDHPTRFTKDGEAQGKIKWIVSVLHKRLEQWRATKWGTIKDESEEMKTQTPSAYQTPVKAKLRDRKRRDPEDADTDEDPDSEGEDTFQDTMSSASSNLADSTRPKVTRKSAATNKDELVTPTKPKFSSTRNPHINFSGVSRGRGGDVLLSPLVDVESPASVFSPAPSEVFSPPLSQPTPDETPASEHQSRYYLRSQKRAEEESPTRRAGRRKSALAAANSETRRGSSSGSDDDAANIRSEESSESEELDYGSSGVDDDPIEYRPKTGSKVSEDQLTEDDDTPSRPPPVSGKGNQRMVFEPLGPKKHPVVNILDRMRRPQNPEWISSGYIYCYETDAAPGHLKIGYVKSEKIEDMGGSGYPSSKNMNKDQVERRLRKWKKTCGYPIDAKFTVFMDCAVQTMESLIHLTLYEKQRKTQCGRCKKVHREWFKITESEALQTVQVWEQFSKQIPYGGYGELVEPWCTYATRRRRVHYDSTRTKEWLSGEWARLVRQDMRKRMGEKEAIVKSQHGLEGKRKELELDKSRLERELAKGKKEIEEIEEEERRLWEQHDKMERDLLWQ